MDISYTYKTRNGTISKTLSVDAAIARVGLLDSREANTRKYAPTDSGDTRFAYNAEAVAIRAAAPRRGGRTIEMDDEEQIYLNPHCSNCGWVFPTTNQYCPACGFPRGLEENENED